MSSTDRKSVVKKQTSELEFQEVLASGIISILVIIINFFFLDKINFFRPSAW
jgi:hypothetical protein